MSKYQIVNSLNQLEKYDSVVVKLSDGSFKEAAFVEYGGEQSKVQFFHDPSKGEEPNPVFEVDNYDISISPCG